MTLRTQDISDCICRDWMRFVSRGGFAKAALTVTKALVLLVRRFGTSVSQAVSATEPDSRWVSSVELSAAPSCLPSSMRLMLVESANYPGRCGSPQHRPNEFRT